MFWRCLRCFASLNMTGAVYGLNAAEIGCAYFCLINVPAEEIGYAYFCLINMFRRQKLATPISA